MTVLHFRILSIPGARIIFNVHMSIATCRASRLSLARNKALSFIFPTDGNQYNGQGNASQQILCFKC